MSFLSDFGLSVLVPEYQTPVCSVFHFNKIREDASLTLEELSLEDGSYANGLTQGLLFIYRPAFYNTLITTSKPSGEITLSQLSIRNYKCPSACLLVYPSPG